MPHSLYQKSHIQVCERKDPLVPEKGLVIGVDPQGDGPARDQDLVCCCHSAQSLPLAFLASQVMGRRGVGGW